MAVNPFNRAGPRVYREFFGTPQGLQILDDLDRQAGNSVFVRGGIEGERETCYRAGKRAIVDHIRMMMNARDDEVIQDE